jgi:hypothetical protein
MPKPKTLALILAGLAAFAQAAPALAAEPKEFPAQNQWVLTLDVKAFQASPLWPFVLDRMEPGKRQETEQKYEAFKALIGADPLKSIDLLVLSGTGDVSQNGVAYVYGAFDEPRLTALLAGAKSYASADVHGLNVQNWLDGETRKYLTFARPGLILSSNSQTALTNALAVLRGDRPGMSADAPAAAAFARDGRTLLALHAGNVASLLGQGGMTDALKLAETLSLSIALPDADSLAASLSATAATDEAAQQLRQMLLGLQALGQIRAGAAPEEGGAAQRLFFSAFAKSAKISGEGRKVGVSLTLTRALVDELFPAKTKPAAP